MKAAELLSQIKEKKQAEVEALNAEMSALETLGQVFETEKKEEIAAAENAILESVGELNGEGKLYSDKEWNDRELEYKAADEAKDTKIAELGKQADDAKAAQAKADERLAKARAQYRTQQQAESESESEESIFGKDEVEVQEPSEQV